MSERTRAEARIASHLEITCTLAEAPTMLNGITGALQVVAGNLDWQYAGFWIVNEHGPSARCIATWHASDLDGTAFDDVRVSATIDRGSGLIGSAWETQQSIWIRDCERETDITRRAVGPDLGFRAALAMPIQLDSQTIAIMEFLATEAREPDQGQIATIESIGSQIGQFIKRKRAERALSESEDRFRMMANSAPVLLWVSEPDGRISWFNNGWLDYTGRSMEEELGHGWVEGIHPEDREQYVSIYAGAIATLQPFNLEFRLRRGDGTYSWIVDRGVPRFDDDGTFAGFIGSSIDISERKHHEHDQAFLSEATGILASSLDYRESLKSVAQLVVPTLADWCVVHIIGEGGAIEPLVITHADPVRLARANDILQRLPSDPTTSGGVADVIRSGQPLLIEQLTDDDLVALAQNEEHLGLFREVAATSVIIQPIIARDRVLGTIALIYSEQARWYDTSDLALIQHLARRTAVAIDNAMLFREAQGAAQARDQFLAVAAHELRSPLTSMKGFAQLLLRRAKRMPGGAEWITPLQTIDTQVDRVTTLVSRLLDVSRIEERRLQLQFDDVDMVEVVRAAAVEAQLATEDHTVVARFAVEELIISIDRTRIEQVLANLFDNAMKYSPEGTMIEIVLQVDDNHVIVSVSDEGIGISSEAQQRMFERYYRGTSSTRTASEGLGLGLYVSHGIVSAHGGQIWVESELAAGTTFSFSLPCSSGSGERGPAVSGGMVGA